MKLLCLTLFNCAKGDRKIDLSRTSKRIRWALGAIKVALGDPKSPHAKAVAQSGFVSIVLVGPDGDQHVEQFALGNEAYITADGRDVAFTSIAPRANLLDARSWLERVLTYVDWCMAVEVAAQQATRPPVYDTASLGVMPEEVVNWVGQAAVAYREEWAKNAHARMAAKVMEPIPLT